MQNEVLAEAKALAKSLNFGMQVEAQSEAKSSYLGMQV